MILNLGLAKKALFGMPEREGLYCRRGFHIGDAAKHARLERVTRCFLYAYNLGLERPDLDDLAFHLELIEPDMKGFCYEAAGMAVALMDTAIPGRKRQFVTFTEGHAHHHSYMAYIGAGLALSIFNQSAEKVNTFIAPLDPLTQLLVFDGYGFHRAFFEPQATLERHEVPKGFEGEILPRFDAGVGRALWFTECGDVERIAASIARFPASRHRAIWSGAGLAASYAGLASDEELLRMVELAGPHAPAWGQGVALATLTRYRAGNPTDYQDRVARLVWGLSGEALHAWVVSSFPQAAEDGSPWQDGEHIWDVFIRRLAAGFASRRVAA